MYRATVTIKGTGALSQSRQHYTDYLDGETHEEYDQRTWREKCTYDEKGIVEVPAMAFKQAMDTAAQRLAIPDPDNRRAGMKKHFVSDVICERGLSIGIHKDKMPWVKVSCNVDGVRGSGKRVPRIFPQTPQWGGTTSFVIMEEKVKQDMFRKVLEAAGNSVGVGQFRAEKGGLNGRFIIVKISYEKM